MPQRKRVRRVRRYVRRSRKPRRQSRRLHRPVRRSRKQRIVKVGRKRVKIPLRFKVSIGSVRDRARAELLRKQSKRSLAGAKRAPKSVAKTSLDDAQELSAARVQRIGRTVIRTVRRKRGKKFVNVKRKVQAAILDVHLVALADGDSPQVRGKVFLHHFKFRFGENGIPIDEALEEIQERMIQYAENVSSWGMIHQTRLRFVSMEVINRARRKRD